MPFSLRTASPSSLCLMPNHVHGVIIIEDEVTACLKSHGRSRPYQPAKSVACGCRQSRQSARSKAGLKPAATM